MRSHRLQRWLTIGAMLALPMMAHAQEATLSGTVNDTTGGVLPGVTVRAVHEASGNSFEAVTDERGAYRLAVRVGAYRLTADLPGFAPVARTIVLLAGQEGVANLQMAVSGVAESVTVTGEAPLLDVTQSTLGGNIDPRQMQDMPLNGRNYLDLVMLAPGVRVNSTQTSPSDIGQAGPSQARGGLDFEINIDGQQINQFTTGGGSEQKGTPKFARDAIAEFELRSSRFDATQGRSLGMQVNVITKSGANRPAGSFAGYFRTDRFRAADFVAKRVLPYENQQFSGTFGGPLRKDKLHFFVFDEYEREPQTFVWTTPYPKFNLDLKLVRTDKKAGGRMDAQFSPQLRLAVRGSGWWLKAPIGSGSSNSTPTSNGEAIVTGSQYLSTLTQVLSNRAVNEIKGGYTHYLTDSHPRIKFPGTLFGSGPTILLTGFSAGSGNLNPDVLGQDTWSIRNDLTYSFTKGGGHTLKLGGEYLYFDIYDLRCISCEGELQATRGPVPANIESLFPNLFDNKTWNLAPLSAVTVRWRQGFAAANDMNIPRYSTGVWVQDDWTLSPRLTMNLGLRYDLELNAFAQRADYCLTTTKCGMQKVELGPFIPANHPDPDDLNNVGPRVGFSFAPNDRTVIRGGSGVYFGTVLVAGRRVYYAQTFGVAIENDGRPDFASNPWNGPTPTYDQLLARFCTPALEPGCIRREAPTAGVNYATNMKMPYSYQNSIGLQRQVGTGMAFEADYVYVGSRGIPITDHPVNISFNPATGTNYPFSDISKRPYPHWGYVSLTADSGSRTNSHALQTSFTKRLSGGWQASGTYTLSILKDANGRPIQVVKAPDGTVVRYEQVPFATAPDFGGEYTLAIADQRHRAVFNGVWDLPYDFQLSGLYFFGSGQRQYSNWGTDLRQLGGLRPNDRRLRPDGTIVPRANFVGKPIHRVDMRLQRRFPLGSRAGIDGILEVFNLTNHVNYGSYVTSESSRNYGQPSQNTNVAFGSRSLQLGFKVTF